MLSPEQMALLDRLFDEASQLPVEERAAFLDRNCPDPEVRAEVESLLPHAASGNTSTPAFSNVVGAAAAMVQHSERQDSMVGPYRIVGLIGEGGMGAVYEGVRDDDQFRKRVAIKTLRIGLRTEPVLRRFLQERQILAELEHPNIARLLDGGTAADGTPYIVMERIDGEPLTAFAEKRMLSIRQKLELFRQIAAAVQYAHQKLIVHRDLKPGNILVDADGVPKLLDFGIAKLLDAELAGAEALTATGFQMMTPDYASPEQVQGKQVTVASDIYSLGAVLYELLSGARPHGLKTYDPAEIAEKVCLKEVTAPSMQGHAALRGDLDTIVLKAMQKDPARRYPSVEQFGDDIRRYLEGLPVLARPDSTMYRMGKFVRRNWIALSAATAVVAALTAGIAVSMYQARLARERFELTRALANRFLFDFHKEIANIPGSTKAQQMVINTAVEYLDKLSKTAGTDAVILEDMAQAYTKLAAVQGGGMTLMAARFKDALASQQRAVEFQRRLAAIDPLKRRMLARGLLDQANIELRLARNADGLTHAQEAVRILEDVAAGPEGADSKLWNEQASAYLYQSRMLKRTGRPADALQSCLKAKEKIQAVLKVNPSMPMVYRETIILEDEGTLRTESGQVEEGVALLEESMRKAAQVVASEPENRMYKRFLSVLMGGVAEAYFSHEMVSLRDPRKSLAIHEQRAKVVQELADSDPADGGARMDLAVSRMEHMIPLGELDPGRALPIGKSAIETWDAVLRSSPGDTFAMTRRARALTRLAMIQLKLGRTQEAISGATEAAAVLDKVLGANPGERFFEMSLVFAKTTAARALAAAGNRPDETAAMFEGAVRAAEQLEGRTPRTLTSAVVASHAYDHYGDYWRSQKNSANARKWYERSVASWAARPESTNAVEQRRREAKAKLDGL
jgi:serine/threonine protein kinase